MKLHLLRSKNAIGFTIGLLIGTLLPIVAALTGSIGPEPPRTAFGELLAWVYMPALLRSVSCFGWPAGIIVIAIVQGLVFGLFGWLGIWLAQRITPRPDAPAGGSRLPVVIGRARYVIGVGVAVLCAAMFLWLVAFVGWYDPKPPLVEAVIDGDTDRARKLINTGADLGVTDSFGYTPLHLAVFGGHERIVEALIDGGADVNAADFSGSTPLISAVSSGHTETAGLLIKAGASVQAADATGRTALHWAAVSGDVDLVRSLIDKGADVNAAISGSGNVGLDGSTPLHWAAGAGDLKVAELLLSKGAGIDAGTGEMGTPLHDAAKYGRREMVLFLIERGADVNAKDRLGATPLGRLVFPHENEEIAELLRQHGGR